eukprot:EG_transcript_12958
MQPTQRGPLATARAEAIPTARADVLAAEPEAGGPALAPGLPPTTEAVRSANAVNVLLMGANMLSVVGCVVLIKAVYQPPYKFTFANTIITIHFLFTGALVNLGALCGLFAPKRIPLAQYLRLSLAQVGSVGFVNLSLFYNSVGMYQVLKFCNIPVICLVEFLGYRIVYSRRTYLALAAIVLGVSLTSVTELSFSPVGFAYGLAGTLATAAYQVLNKQIQKAHEVNAMQLLQFESWFTAFWAFLWALAGDDVQQLARYQWTGEAWVLIALSGVCAFGVNLTCYLVIGRTSPVTYGVTGHVKTIAILLFGFLVLGQPFSLRNTVGIYVAFCGMVYYTYVKLAEQAEALAK